MNVLKWELRRRWVRRKVRLSVTGTLPDLEGAAVDTEARHALRRITGVGTFHRRGTVHFKKSDRGWQVTLANIS